MKQYEHAGTDSVEVTNQFNEESIEMKEFRQMELEKSQAEQKVRRKSEAPQPQAVEDWFGSDYSCCLCVPIKTGVYLIGLIQVINAVAVMLQINGITDDGSSKGEKAGPRFYYMSYLCWSPWLYAIWCFLRFMKNDNFENRNGLVKGSYAIAISLSALYTWFFVYFVSIEDNDFATKDTIFLVVLLFAVPQILTHL